MFMVRVHSSALLSVDLELLPGREQRGAIDLLRGLNQRGVHLLLRHLHDALQEQLGRVALPKILKVLLLSADHRHHGWLVTVELCVQGEPEGCMSTDYWVTVCSKQ